MNKDHKTFGDALYLGVILIAVIRILDILGDLAGNLKTVKDLKKDLEEN